MGFRFIYPRTTISTRYSTLQCTQRNWKASVRIGATDESTVRRTFGTYSPLPHLDTCVLVQSRVNSVESHRMSKIVSIMPRTGPGDTSPRASEY